MKYDQLRKWPIDGFYLYILGNNQGEYYVGITSRPKKRLRDHNTSQTLEGVLVFKYIRYVGSLFKALKAEQEMQKMLEPTCMIYDPRIFECWLKTLGSLDPSSLNVTMRFLYDLHHS